MTLQMKENANKKINITNIEAHHAKDLQFWLFPHGEEDHGHLGREHLKLIICNHLF